MDTLLVKPKNRKDLDFVNGLLKRMNVREDIVSTEKQRKPKAKKAFLDSLPGRPKEAELHMQGKIELPTWLEVAKGL